MDINQIEIKYLEGYYTYTSDMNVPQKVSSDHVFDEDLSVRRNREMVEEHNQKVDEIKAEIRKKQSDLNKQLSLDVAEYIVENYGLTFDQAKLVESFVYIELHSNMHEYFAAIDTYAEFADTLLNQVEG
jgi:hypothetical protein